MTLDEFFNSDWKIMGMRTDKIQLGRSEPTPKLIWIKLHSFITLAHKLHLDYGDSEVENLLEEINS